MNDNKLYTPVSCDLHSQFELLIMHNNQINMHWQDEKGHQHNSIVRPKDIQTKAGEEFLIVVDSNNEQLNIRLDRIHSFEKIGL